MQTSRHFGTKNREAVFRQRKYRTPICSIPLLRELFSKSSLSVFWGTKPNMQDFVTGLAKKCV
jgi:hypothetical protein